MKSLLRDPFFWGSLAFVVVIPASDFFVLERNYYDSGSYFPMVFFMLGLQGLWLVWLLICLLVTIHRLRKWRWAYAGALLAAVIVFPLNHALSSTTLWQHYNYHQFHEARLSYARHGDGNWHQCSPATEAWNNQWYSTLAIEKDQPEVYGTGSGPYVFYKTFAGIPDGMWGFLYAPSLDDPIKDLPQLNLEFAVLWDREACVFLAGNR
jgi:hypothetical protein